MTNLCHTPCPSRIHAPRPIHHPGKPFSPINPPDEPLLDLGNRGHCGSARLLCCPVLPRLELKRHRRKGRPALVLPRAGGQAPARGRTLAAAKCFRAPVGPCRALDGLSAGAFFYLTVFAQRPLPGMGAAQKRQGSLRQRDSILALKATNQRVGVISDRQRCRPRAVFLKPALYDLDDARDCARFPLGLDSNLLEPRVEPRSTKGRRASRAAVQAPMPWSQSLTDTRISTDRSSKLELHCRPGG